MSWAVGEDRPRLRHIGYGVTALCDHPDCGKEIDRGLSFACSECPLFFCAEHRWLNTEGGYLCDQCAYGRPMFAPSPDAGEWVDHVLTDPSWTEFRKTEPMWTAEYRARASLDGAA